MSRKKAIDHAPADEATETGDQTFGESAASSTPEDSVVVPAVDPAAESPADSPAVDSPAVEDTAPTGWGNPYKALFTSPVKGFELGENRRFKQLVFTFTDNPGAEVTKKLKEAGFVYRAAEKSWTQPATAVSRQLAVDLARELKGEHRGHER